MIFFLLTTRFPYENGESFISNELPYLSKKDIVYIVPFNEKDGNLKFSIPDNCRLIKKSDFKTNLTEIFFCLLRRDHIKVFISEIEHLIKEKCFHYLTFKRAVAYMFYASRERVRLDKITEKYAKDTPYILYSYWASIYAVAATLKKSSSSYCVTRMHGIDLYEERHEYGYLPFRTLLFDRLDMICPISEAAKYYLVNKYQNKFPVHKCYVSHLGTKDCGVNKFINRQEIIVVSCSSIIKVKQVDLIWKALSGISEFAVRWFHFGDGALMETLKETIYNMSNDKIQYNLMGYVNNKEVYEFYQKESVDLFLNVSQSEGIPVSIMEAISFGIPVIATDVGGTHEIVNTNTGWLIPVDNIIEELQMRIKEYYTMDVERKMEKRHSTREFWEQMYKADRNYKDFYNKVKANMIDWSGNAFSGDKHYNSIL